MIATIENLRECTAQDIFNTIAAHLLKQNKASKEGLRTRYKNDQGLKCAAGCLIPDHLYNPKIEGLNWNYLVQRGTVPGDHFLLIRALQHFHDSVPAEDWLRKIGFIAADWELVFRYDVLVA